MGEKSLKSRQERQRHTYAHKNTKATAIMDPGRPVSATSVFVSPFEPCLVETVGCVLLMSSISSDFYHLPLLIFHRVP